MYVFELVILVKVYFRVRGYSVFPEFSLNLKLPNPSSELKRVEKRSVEGVRIRLCFVPNPMLTDRASSQATGDYFFGLILQLLLLSRFFQDSWQMNLKFGIV